MDKIYLQELKNYNSVEELEKIGFDRSYLLQASKKYESRTLKICSLKAIEANILKQTALSLGSDCAVHKNVILNTEGEFDSIICATDAIFLKIAEKLKQQQFRLKNVAEEIIKTFEKNSSKIKIGEETFNFAQKKYIMGILNLTPDSFSDGGKYFTPNAAIEQYKKLINDGADIIDIGAESTRPNFKPISPDEEIERLKIIFNNEDFKADKTPKSIDTFNYKTAEFAIKNSIDIINDVTGFTDKNMITLAADTQKPIIVMFNQKILPDTNTDTFSQMYDFFVQRIDELATAGVKAENIIIDCGFGFFKNNEENVKMLDWMTNLKNLKCPILLGISRKSFFKFINADADKDQLSALLAAKYVNDYDIVRVHNVLAHSPIKFL